MWKNDLRKHIGDSENRETIAIDIEKVYGHRPEEIYKELKRFSSIIEQSIDSIAITDLELKFTYASVAFARMHGYSPEEMIGMKIVNLHSKEQTDEYRMSPEQIKTENWWMGEIDHIKKDGTSLPICVSVSSLKERGGLPIGILVICRDITQRKKAEKKLKENEAKYRSLFENMLDSFAYCKIIIDEKNKPIDFIYLEVNSAFEILTGLKRKDIIGKKVTKVIPGIKEAHPELFDIYGKVALTGKGDKFDIYFAPLNIWLSISVYSFQESYFVTVFENITVRKKIEKELIKTSERLKYLLTATAVSIYTAEPSGNYAVTSVTGNVEQMTGYEPNQFTDEANFWINHVHPEDKKRVLKEVLEIFTTGKHIFEYRFLCKDGKYIWMRDDMRLVKDAFRNPIEIVGYWIDITKQKHVEEALRDKAILRQIFLDSLPPVAMLLRPSTREIVACNKAGKEVGAVPGKTCFETWGRSDSPCPWCLASKVWISRESQHLQTWGNGRFWDAHWVPVAEDLYLHYAYDITERKKAEEAAKEQQVIFKRFSGEILSIREKEKKKLSTNLHDEVGSLGVSLSVHLSIIKENIKDNNLETALKSIRQTGKTLKASIASFKNIAADLRPPDLDIIGLPGALKAYFAKIAKQAKIKIDFRADKNIKIVNDETAITLYRVAQEALSNIIKHAKAKNVKLRLYSQENNLKFNICDDGKGFDIERSLQTSEILKMGILGMRERVESLGGVFIIESTPKKGTGISIVVPDR